MGDERRDLRVPHRVLFAAEPSLYGDRVVAYPMPAERSISIDDLEDWAAAERALASRASHWTSSAIDCARAAQARRVRESHGR